MIQDGDYRKLIDFLNQLQCDHVVLETTRRSEKELAAIKEIDKRIGLGLGVIDVKDLQVESPEQVAARIESLARLLQFVSTPEERLRAGPNQGRPQSLRITV